MACSIQVRRNQEPRFGNLHLRFQPPICNSSACGEQRLALHVGTPSVLVSAIGRLHADSLSGNDGDVVPHRGRGQDQDSHAPFASRKACPAREVNRQMEPLLHTRPNRERTVPLVEACARSWCSSTSTMCTINFTRYSIHPASWKT